jgi:hypothetical protein
MDYEGLVKSLDLPAGYTPPTELAHENIHARAISRADLDDDVRGINASLEIIPHTARLAAETSGSPNAVLLRHHDRPPACFRSVP